MLPSNGYGSVSKTTVNRTQAPYGETRSTYGTQLELWTMNSVDCLGRGDVSLYSVIAFATLPHTRRRGMFPGLYGMCTTRYNIHWVQPLAWTGTN